MRGAVIRFLILSGATLLVLGVLATLASRYIAREEALRDARGRSEAMAHGLAAPLVSSAVRRREPVAMHDLDLAMRNRIRYGSVTHIVLWDAEGRVLWAEDQTAVGLRFDLPPELREVAGSGGTVFEPTGERESHPGRDVGEEELLEIYVGAVDADGERFLFEAYLDSGRIDQDFRAVLWALLPLSLLLLLLMQAATLPLALSLARRIDRANAHHSDILKRSLQSWHEERHLLAQELHDGVVQDLAGMSYAMHGVLEQLPEGARADQARATGQVMNNTLVRSLAALRAVLLDLAPAGLAGPALMAALESLCQHVSTTGVDVTLDMDASLDVDESVGGLIYRVVREGLRNVEKHAAASSVLVSVRRHRDTVEIVLADDGRGVPSAPAGSEHVGLRLLDHVLRDVGGTIALDNDSQGGATLRVVLPGRLADFDEQP